jgi:hypothetical protein
MSHLLSQQKLRYPDLRGDDFRDPRPESPRETKTAEITLISRERYTKPQHLHANPQSAPSHRHVTMHLVAKACDTPKLRHIAALICGDNLLSVRISPISCTKNVHFWLSLKCDGHLVDKVMVDIMRHVPSAQFGRFDTV